MTAPQAKPLTKRAARSLINEFRQHIGNAGVVLQKLIKGEAWLALGYDSFTEMWDAELSDMALTSAMKSMVVYQMFDEGADVVGRVAGVGVAQEKALKGQHDAGIPSEVAKGRSKKTTAQKAPRKHWVHVEVDGEELHKWKQIAKDYDTTVEGVMLEQAREWFNS